MKSHRIKNRKRRKNTLTTMLRYAALSFIAITGFFTSVANAAICEHVVQNHWNSGFVATIRLTNDGDTAINGWNVSWSYADGAERTSGWNANVTGGNPYSATPLSWNSTINPGQTVEFGFQGNLGQFDGPAPTAVVTGDICGSTPPPVDNDGDGVPDSVDQCPNTPAGDEVDADGCTVDMPPQDSDNDGVPDSVDQCPNTPAGDEVDADGCTVDMPPLDSDNDGVPDSLDLCPNTPAGDEVDADGCTVDMPPQDSDNDGIPDGVDQCPNTPAGDIVDATGCTIISTEGLFRVDAAGNITKNGVIKPIQCGNWFGLEGQHEPVDAANNPNGAPMELNLGNMWWADTGRTMQQIMTEITAQGINVVRLPIAPQTLDPTDPQGIGDIQAGGVLKNHPSVRQTNARQGMVDFIMAAEANGIDVIIDIHSCSNYVGWRAGRLDSSPPYADADRIDYDFFREDYSCGTGGDGVTIHPYNQQIWLNNLREIAGLSEELGVNNILGIDIFNEPWDYTWQEWKALSESAFEAINEVNQDVLIFVEGIGSGLKDGTDVDHGELTSNPNWGENFYGMRDDPLNIPKERLVLSPHTYGPSVFVQMMFMDPAQPECEGLFGDEAGVANCNLVINPTILEAGWEEHFGYLKDQNYAMVVGEFGGNMDWPALGTSQGIRDMWSHITPGVDEEWQNAFVDYAIEREIQGCYWSINPESGDTGGLYLHAYDPVSNTPGWGTWLGLDMIKWNLLDRLWGN